MVKRMHSQLLFSTIAAEINNNLCFLLVGRAINKLPDTFVQTDEQARKTEQNEYE